MCYHCGKTDQEVHGCASLVMKTLKLNGSVFKGGELWERVSTRSRTRSGRTNVLLTEAKDVEGCEAFMGAQISRHISIMICVAL